MAATQWPQQNQQYQQQAQHHQQSQQYAQGQQSQQPQQYQQYQQNPQYQIQQHQFQQQPQGYPVQQYHHNQQYHAYNYQQPHQGQPPQQYQQVRQGPPEAQQYSQNQLNQSVQQYPQQQYHNYQQPYPPHQYSSQQYTLQQQGSTNQRGSHPVYNSPPQPASQQHGTSRYGIDLQTSQPQHNPVQVQSPAHTAPQPCFNCGNSGHFAMDCPEPIRSVPAGKVNPQAFQNPLRRPKTSGTAVNHPQYTPQPSHAQVSPTAYPPAPYGQPGHPQSQQAYSPTIPSSAQSSAQAQYYEQWQQYYRSQQAYQQGSHHQQQESPYPQQPYAVPHGQAVGHPNISQMPNQAPDHHPPYSDVTQMYQSRFTPTSAGPLQSIHQSSSNEVATQPDQGVQSLASVKSQSKSLTPQKTQILDYDFEEDDLESLDIPDLPQTTLPLKNVSRQPINLIGHPLPGNFVVADALAPFPSPAPQDKGYCKSRYQHDANLEACAKRFKDSKYWDKEHADDVVFFDLPVDGKIVPVDDILSIIRHRRAHPESSDDVNRDSRSQSRTVSMNQDSLDVRITLDKMERELAETKAKLEARLGKGRAADPLRTSTPKSVKLEQPHLRDHEIKEGYQTPSESTTSVKPMKSEQDAEEILAALGVTGAPKPVTATAMPDEHVEYSSPNDMHMSPSSGSSRADILGRDQHQLHSNHGLIASGYHAKDLTSSNHHSGPPPPPPTCFRQQSHPDGTHARPLSSGSAENNPSGYDTNGVDHINGIGNGVFSPPTDGQASSPTETRSEKSLGRKRHRDSSSDEEDTMKRRQEDDYTPKLKKRQPKVAAAYSRRW